MATEAWGKKNKGVYSLVRRDVTMTSYSIVYRSSDWLVGGAYRDTSPDLKTKPPHSNQIAQCSGETGRGRTYAFTSLALPLVAERTYAVTSLVMKGLKKLKKQSASHLCDLQFILANWKR